MDDKKKAKVIAFYLPQFHPIPENDEWWGKGFTEWTNVGKAIKYYRSHYQPKVPADLGYYDLRLPEVREAQAELAREAQIDAFCYWHYWFGNGKQLLEKPLQEMIRLGKPDFPFCLGWANHAWSKKNWNKDVNRLNDEVLIKQNYPGEEDIDNHFYTMLPAFKDERYYKVHGKLLFCIYSVIDIPNFEYFINRWQELAQLNGLPGFFFAGCCMAENKINHPNYKLCDSIILFLLNFTFFGKSFKWRKRLAYFFPFPINRKSYSFAIKKWKNPLCFEKNIYPTIVPNWDHSPRSGRSGTILHNSTPELFYKHVKNTLSYLEKKGEEDKIIFLRSWNEWGEGNYMEPDLKYGKGYINALKRALNDGE